MINGTQPTLTQTNGQTSQVGQGPSPTGPKKSKGFKIFLGILGGCVVILIIIGVVGWILAKKAAKKAGEEFEKASKELEKSFNELEKINPSLNEQLENLKNMSPAPTGEETEITPGP